jgi:hypothetical protein
MTETTDQPKPGGMTEPVEAHEVPTEAFSARPTKKYPVYPLLETEPEWEGKRPPLSEAMRAQPGRFALLVAEWVAVALLIVGGLSVMFLLAVGAYTLIAIAPSA